MDQHNRYFGSNRQSLRPSSGSTMASSMLASRYGFQFGSNSSSSSCKRPGSNNTSPNRSRSNSASRFKAAAAVAVAAATGSKQFGSNHRSSVSMPFNVLTGNSSSTSNQIANSSGASGSSSDGNTAGISSTVVSFMRKFVNKASPHNSSGDSIDFSFEQYQKNQLQQQQQQQQQQQTQQSTSSTSLSHTKSILSTLAGNFVQNNAGGQTSDTGYSSNANSPVTTPTVAQHSTNQSSIPVFNAGSNSITTTLSSLPTTCSPTESLTSLSSSIICQIDPASSSSRPSSAASVLNSSNASVNPATVRTGPLFSKIKAKVASTFQQQQQQQQQQPLSSQSNSTTSSILHSPIVNQSKTMEIGNDGKSIATEQSADLNLSKESSGYQRAPKLASISSQSSSLTNEQLTAHLTEEERQILQKVWQKEEEFALKNFTRNMASSDLIGSTIDTPTSSAVIGSLSSIGLPSSTNSISAVSSVSHLSTNLLDPVAAAVHRRRSSAVMSADATGFCRICRKVIMKNETSHRCSNCQELVCDDCSSYSSREESKYWMCSFCRRRGSHLVLVTSVSGSSSNTVTNSFVSNLDNHRSSMPSTISTNISTTNTTFLGAENNFLQQKQSSYLSTTPGIFNAKRKLSYQETRRPKSSMDQFDQNKSQNRQSSLDLSPATSRRNDNNVNLSIRNDDNQVGINSTILNDSRPIPDTRTRIYSLSDDDEIWLKGENEDGDDNSDFEGLDDDVIIDDQIQNQESLPNLPMEQSDLDSNLTNQIESIEREHFGGNNSRRLRAKSLTQSQPKNLDSYYGTLQSVPVEMLKQERTKLQSKRKKKFHQNSSVPYNSDDELLMNNSYSSKNNDSLKFARNPPIMITSLDCKENDDCNVQSDKTINPELNPANNENRGVSYQQCQSKQPTMIPNSMPRIVSINSTKLPPGVIVASHWLRLTNKVRSLNRTNGIPETFYGTQKQLSSESSDFSEGIKYSPPQDSLTPSSDYSRSPRESADSEMFGINSYALAAHCRGIPSVLIDDDGPGGSTLLSAKDCYFRRGSAGRALPKIPVVTSGSSMLDLPHYRKNSHHSLDIPKEQPRRASAPESGDSIRIVIDDCEEISSEPLDSIKKSDPSVIDSQSPSTNGEVLHHKRNSVGPISAATLQQRVRYQMSRAASITTHYDRVVLHRDKTDQSHRTRGFSLAITGGKLCDLSGMLYAYITWIKPGGQADNQSLKAGDKILELNGKSLVNCSYEQVCHIMDSSGDSIELIIESMVRNNNSNKRRHSFNAQQRQTKMHLPDSSDQSNKIVPETIGSSVIDSSLPTKNQQLGTARPSSAAAVISTATDSPIKPLGVPSANTNLTLNTTGSSLRRRLPQIPKQFSSQKANKILSEFRILIQATIDPNIRQLSVMIIKASGLDCHKIYKKNFGLEAYAQLRLLPEMGFKICQTELSREFDWNETLIYHHFPLERIENVTLDLSVWLTFASNYMPDSSQTLRNQILKQSSNSAEISINDQLASTRIPLRNALMIPNTEWWPLIPCDPNAFENIDGQIPIMVPTSETLIDSMTNYMQKAPSLDQIGEQNKSNTLLPDINATLMTSRSTPGSRRNSNRSDREEPFSMNFFNDGRSNFTSSRTRLVGNRIKPLSISSPSSQWYQRYRSSPSYASSTLSSSTGGRRSLDESYSISNSLPSGDCIRSTSLRLAPNRHSVGNLFHVGPTGNKISVNLNQTSKGSFLDAYMERRKSSSVIARYRFDPDFRQQNQRKNNGNYLPMEETDSYQYLMEQNDRLIDNRSQNTINLEMGYQSDQESNLETSDDDEDFDNLFKYSNYTIDSLDNRDKTTNCKLSNLTDIAVSVQKTISNKTEQEKEKNYDGNLLTVHPTSSRLSVATTTSTSPRTPSNEYDENDDEFQNEGGLMIPICKERRPSFLRRLVPSAAETMMNMVIGNPGSNAQPSDEILQPNSVDEHRKKTVIVVGEIKLGFIMTKGFLEIEVIAARNLPDSKFGPHPPETYVKTYLVDRGRQIYKRKTRVAGADKNPQYRQTLKYDASIIYGRTLLVSVWEKQRRKRTFDANSPIGSCEINVNQLQLHKLTIRWFKLRSFAHSDQNQKIETSDQIAQNQNPKPN